MKGNKSLVVYINKLSDINKISDDTKYININITDYDYDIITYFLKNGQNYLYSEIIDNIPGYIYVNYEEFIKAESTIDMIYANMPENLTKLEQARYIYISIGKLVSFDLNFSMSKTEFYNINLINNATNIWGSLSAGRVNDISASKIYYYLCRRLDIDATFVIDKYTNDSLNKLIIDNQVLYVDIYKDIPYIQSQMQTIAFSTYNDDLDIDRKAKYIKKQYNNYYLDKNLRNINFDSDDCIKEILLKTEKIFNIEGIKPMELSIIYEHIFLKYCPNYDVKINNFYLNNKNKNHFIMISHNNLHYSYNYKEKQFIKINELEIINNLKNGKICLYKNELIPNINY